jgi:hypothetical protein
MSRLISVNRLRDLATRPASLTRSNIAISAESAEEVRALAAEVLHLRERLAEVTNLDCMDAEVISLRAQLRREQDARADLRVELGRVNEELSKFRAKVNAQTFEHAETGRRLHQVTGERDLARRELVHAMQTIEAASIALGGCESRESSRVSSRRATVADQQFLERLHDRLAAHLDRITKLFKPGAKLTLVVRQPDLPGDTGILIGNDDYDAVIAEIQKLREHWRPFEPSREAVEAVDDESRCAVCAWPLALTIKVGCVRGACSLRPPPERYYAPERAKREADERTGRAQTAGNRGCQREDCVGFCYWCTPPRGRLA